jgi:hypothetical protein
MSHSPRNIEEKVYCFEALALLRQRASEVMSQRGGKEGTRASEWEERDDEAAAISPVICCTQACVVGISAGAASVEFLLFLSACKAQVLDC